MSEETAPETPNPDSAQSPQEGVLVQPRKGKSASYLRIVGGSTPPRADGRGPAYPRLNSARAILRELAKTYRQSVHGLESLENATKRTYMLTSMAKVYEAVETEERVMALEERLNLR